MSSWPVALPIRPVNPNPGFAASKGQDRRNDARRRMHPMNAEDAMDTTTKRYLSRREPFRPIFGFAAVMATAATLGLAVVTPASLPHTDAIQLAQPASHPAPGATEVAILPGAIEVVAKRTRTAGARTPYLPAAYHYHPGG
jgi:hypothetical protein